jgi:undecaprenyl-diphosphatase
MQLLFSIDKNITETIYQLLPHNQFFNAFFSFFSLYGGSIFIWLLVIIFIVIIEEIQHPGIQKIDRIFILYSFLAFGISYLLNEFILKNIFHRLRPSNFNQFQQISTSFNCPLDFSFPSSHAMTAFAIATIISYFDKKRRWLYYLIALLISLSRIYLGCHYFFDVVVGAVLGFLISIILLRFVPETSPSSKKK